MAIWDQTSGFFEFFKVVLEYLRKVVIIIYGLKSHLGVVSELNVDNRPTKSRLTVNNLITFAVFMGYFLPFGDQKSRSQSFSNVFVTSISLPKLYHLLWDTVEALLNLVHVSGDYVLGKKCPLL